MNRAVTLQRNSTSITVAEFYERDQLNKYNFNPPYQRKGDVWDQEKQSFLIDTILKNFPMPPIFLHQRIDTDTGATLYDVIDGKQRLQSILKFISNEIPLPSDFDDGLFGNELLNSLFFVDLKGHLSEYKQQLWSYRLTVEYIEEDDEEVINNIFDRLNRNGEPLEPQELRKARHHNSSLFHSIEKVSSGFDWDYLAKIKFNRMQDEEFISELMFYLLEKGANDASLRSSIDASYEKWVIKGDQKLLEDTEYRFREILDYIKKLDIDFQKYQIKGVSHFYAMFAAVDQFIEKGINETRASCVLNKFYSKVRDGEDSDDLVVLYRGSMQSNTKSKSARQRRIKAIIDFADNF